MTSVRPAESGSNADTAYDNSPLNAHIIAGLAANKEAHATIDNLNEVFPNGYKIIVYLNGHRMVQNACIYLTKKAVQMIGILLLIRFIDIQQLECRRIQWNSCYYGYTRSSAKSEGNKMGCSN